MTQDPPACFVEKFDLVLTHRLLNQFTREEAIRALCNMAKLLRSHGRIRTSVKLGLYPSDSALIALGEQQNTVHHFYDPCTKTIDFSAARDLLNKWVQTSSDIPEETLIKWYTLRGKITRFEHQGIIDIVSTCQQILLESVIQPARTNVADTWFYTFTN